MIHEKILLYKLLKLLAECEVKKKLLELVKISIYTLAKIKRRENANTEISEEICIALQCDTKNICDIETEESENV